MDLQDPAQEVEDCGKKEEEGSCGQLCDTVSVCVLSCELQQPVSSAKPLQVRNYSQQRALGSVASSTPLPLPCDFKSVGQTQFEKFLETRLFIFS